MYTMLKTGHVSSCPAAFERNAVCAGSCETARYTFTGILAVSAGFVEGGIGLSLSLILVGDGLHALADGAGDFVSAFVAKRAHRDKENAHALRHNGNRVIAILISLSAAWMIWEVVGRFFEPPSVSASAMIIAPLLVAGVHLVRVATLHASPFRNITRSGLLKHAMGDLFVSTLAVLVGVLALIASTWAPYLDLVGSVLITFYLLHVALSLWFGKGHMH